MDIRQMNRVQTFSKVSNWIRSKRKGKVTPERRLRPVQAINCLIREDKKKWN
jgi:hypothetical protein